MGVVRRERDRATPTPPASLRFGDIRAMPRSARVSGQKRRPQKSARRILDDMRIKLLDIEVPLNDAIDHVQALRLIGQGLIAEYHDAGSPIIATARDAEARLDALKEIWDTTREIGRRSANERRCKRT